MGELDRQALVRRLAGIQHQTADLDQRLTKLSEGVRAQQATLNTHKADIALVRRDLEKDYTHLINRVNGAHADIMEINALLNEIAGLANDLTFDFIGDTMGRPRTFWQRIGWLFGWFNWREVYHAEGASNRLASARAGYTESTRLGKRTSESDTRSAATPADPALHEDVEEGGGEAGRGEAGDGAVPATAARLGGDR